MNNDSFIISFDLHTYIAYDLMISHTGGSIQPGYLEAVRILYGFNHYRYIYSLISPTYISL
jgi:hypothetical protein